MEVFSVIKLEIFFQKTSASTFICASECFRRADNETSSLIKKSWQPKFLEDVFLAVRLLDKSHGYAINIKASVL